MRCLKCGMDGIESGATHCPNPNCRVNLKAVLLDTLTPGRELHRGRYRIEYALGKGGFGVTYRGQLTATGGAVAIKEFCPMGIASRDPNSGSLSVSVPDIPEFKRSREVFNREAQILENVTHANIVRIRDFFDENNTSYLVMEFLTGPSLRNRLRSSLPSVEEIVWLMNGLVSALAAVHAKGIYHLDIKPPNIIIEPERGAVLIDFGAARQGTNLSDLSSLPQTRAYAPLEMVRPERGRDDAYGPETDIFEVGVTLYEMLTGKLPPPADARAVGQEWDLSDLQEPWLTLVREATRLERSERPRDIARWWGRVGEIASLPPRPIESEETRLPESIRPLQNTAPTAGTAGGGGGGGTGGYTAPTGGPSTAVGTRGNEVSVGGSTGTRTPVPPSLVTSDRRPSEDNRPPVSGPAPMKNLVWMAGAGVVAVGAIAALLINGAKKPTPEPTPTPVVATPTPEPTPTPAPTPQGPSEAERAAATDKLKRTLDAIENAPDPQTKYTDFVAYMDNLAANAGVAVRGGADVTVKNAFAETTLHLSPWKDNESLTAACIQGGANVNAKDSDGWTPLHKAALAPAPKVADLLLKAGADPTIEDSKKRTPLMLAKEKRAAEKKPDLQAKYDEVIQLLEAKNQATPTPASPGP